MAQPKSKLTIKLLNLEEVDFTNPEQKIKRRKRKKEKRIGRKKEKRY